MKHKFTVELTHHFSKQIRTLDISYVYIGSTATTYSLENSYRRQFNATQFLSTPYFTLTKEIGDAWLFQFNASAALAAYKNYVTPD